MKLQEHILFRKTKSKSKLIGEIKNLNFENIFGSNEENSLNLLLNMILTTNIKNENGNNINDEHKEHKCI